MILNYIFWGVFVMGTIGFLIWCFVHNYRNRKEENETENVRK